MKRVLIALTIALIGLTEANAQMDRHYSMFYGNALSINPASAGMLNGDARFFGSYRSQWSSVTTNPYKTMNFNVDGRILKDKIKEGRLGVGLSFYHDKAGAGNMSSLNAGFAASYGIEIYDDIHLSVGAQGAYGQYSITTSNFTWGTQWTGSGYDQNLASFEPGYADVNAFFDLSAGAYVYGSLGNHIDLHGGFSVLHITAQDVSMAGLEERLYRNFTLSLFPEIRIPYQRFGFVPGVLAFFQGPNKELMLGTDVKYYIKESSHYTGYYEEVSASLGSFWRAGDAIVITAGFNYSGISAGVAYDFNYSSLNAASNWMGAYEFYLRYRLGFNYRWVVGGKGRF
jgi:type IX secretion system PorP/SprF family membrane protein